MPNKFIFRTLVSFFLSFLYAHFKMMAMICNRRTNHEGAMITFATGNDHIVFDAYQKATRLMSFNLDPTFFIWPGRCDE